MIVEIYEPACVSTDDVDSSGAAVAFETTGEGGDGPRVSCLMVTKGDPGFVQCAVESFMRQSYPDKELIVVCDRSARELEQCLASIEPGHVRVVRATRKKCFLQFASCLCKVVALGRYGSALRLLKGLVANRWPLGFLRNLAVSEASGDLVCQWDDDDLYHKERISVQVAALLESGAAAVMLKRWLVWVPAREMLVVSVPRIWEGSMLAWKKLLPRYRPVARAEDTALVNKLCRRHRVGLLDMPELYCYTVHGANTWGVDHFDGILKACKPHSEGYMDGLRKLKGKLPFERHPHFRREAADLSD